MRAGLVACGHVELAFGDSLRRLHIEHRGAGVIELRRYIEIGDYALAIYQRIGSPGAQRVQETLLQFRQGNLAPAPER